MAQGTWEEIAATEGSVTGDYLAGRIGECGPDPLTGDTRAKQWIRMTGLRGHNLKNIELDIPLGRLTLVHRAGHVE